MISRPPPPRGYKYNPVNGRLEKKPKGIRTVGRGHRRRKRRRGGDLASNARKVEKMVRALATKQNLNKVQSFLNKYL